jgi:hypothetical protein
MAEAQRGRAAGERLRPKFPGFSRLERDVIQHARIFTEPAVRRLAGAEPLLKRSIPILITAFLLVVAISRRQALGRSPFLLRPPQVLPFRTTASPYSTKRRNGMLNSG